MVSDTGGAPQLLGGSAAMATLRAEIAAVAHSDARVLITGESGSGKEVVAREIHGASRRAQQPLVVVNCAGLSEPLLESELFGHVRGSFTGAFRDKGGKLELADEGTVLLDEISDMTPRLQALLLRFIETGEIQKVGADGAPTRVRVRMLAATNRNISELVARGDVREDLFYRLNVVHIDVPPLRERIEDVPALIAWFLERLRHGDRSRVRGITPEAVTALTQYSWPGNVRELQNVVERMVLRSHDELIRIDDLPGDLLGPGEAARRPFRERRRSITDGLYARMVREQQSFWTLVYPMYMRRDLTRDNLRQIVARGLREAGGNYRIVATMFNIQPHHYKKFLNFLRQQQCQPAYREFR
jgi:transcriptional regulator with PAS, ATPase and Fis domain